MTSPAAQELYGRWLDSAQASFRTCLEAGVTIATGTDAGNPGTFHGRAMRRELALYVENGMRPIEALEAATRTAADALGRSDLGRIEAGAIADLLIVEGDATMDIEALSRVRAVYRAGRALDLDALSVQSETSLTNEPTTDLAEGQTCLSPDECNEELYCGWQYVCAERCRTSSDCASGSACLYPQPLLGFCYVGDGCDPIAQDCENGEACIWLGNEATLCWYASTQGPGEPCSATGTCAPGAQCNFATNRCVQLCAPAGSDECPEGQTCIDRSEEAGVPVGECG